MERPARAGRAWGAGRVRAGALWGLCLGAAVCVAGCGADPAGGDPASIRDAEVVSDVAHTAADTGDTAGCDTAPDAAPDAGPVVPPGPTAGPFLASATLGRPLLIAHRGGGRLAPEETLPAYENAWALGADVLEVDVHATKDGVLVAMHDATVDRTTDGTGAIQAMTFDALRRLDAGYRFSPGDGTHPYRGQAVVVPTLDELLDAFPEALWSIEIKQQSPPIAQAVVSTLRAHAAGAGPSLGRVIVVSFFDDTMAEVRSLAAAEAPSLVTGFALGEMLSFVAEGAAPGYVPPAQVLQLPVETPEDANGLPGRLGAAHALGLAVQLWTVNDRALMEALVTRPVDGIMTDDPALLLDVMREAGLR